ncbi:hypothetical protein SAMN02745751_00144 [Dethiosulfatibacter aminovorans DSM 17477]|uniref:Uncharacterized protein n=1 Tax=Dethiosulfatibacter aminovorans DSM 17477 TaxID=1121476 RepID=A0A1M6AJQ6_9FIRM|nr:hypothetical protein SAMN02745751_00144 [Dethiosulfatibacter aminovorans DSM 17477]
MNMIGIHNCLINVTVPRGTIMSTKAISSWDIYNVSKLKG